MWYAIGYAAFIVASALGLGKFIRAGSEPTLPPQPVAAPASDDEVWLEDAYLEFFDTGYGEDEAKVFKRLMRAYGDKRVREAAARGPTCH